MTDELDPNDIFGAKLSALMELALEGELSEWETDFLQSCAERFEKGDSFSDKQLEIINELWEKKCNS